MKITVMVIASIWPILLNVVSAINQLGNGLFEMGKTLHLNRVDILRKLLIPAILPGFLIGIRVAAPLAVIITLLIEMLTAMPGLGGLMIAGQRNFNASQVFGILIVVGIVGLAVNQLSLFLEKILLAYKPPKTQR
jgi:ABC-type nitrate/sulfonate/bicarbonate transport system permease component